MLNVLIVCFRPLSWSQLSELTPGSSIVSLGDE